MYRERESERDTGKKRTRSLQIKEPTACYRLPIAYSLLLLCLYYGIIMIEQVIQCRWHWYTLLFAGQ